MSARREDRLSDWLWQEGVNAVLDLLGRGIFVSATFAAAAAGVCAAQCEFDEIWTLRDESSGFSQAIAIGSDFAAIGAPRDSDPTVPEVAGAVYVFSGEPGFPWTWTLTDRLSPPGVRHGEEFGWSVAQDNGLLVIGARKGDAFPDYQSDTGLVYVYQRSSEDTWDQLDVASALAQGQEKLGESVAVSVDTIVAGAPEYNDLSTARDKVGRAVVFERSPTDPDHWVQVKSIVPVTSTENSRFGASVAISGDIIVVGAPTSAEIGANAGAAFVYERDASDPDDWHLLARLNPGDLNNGARFGWSVKTNGQLILVGAIRRSGVRPNAGRVYVYHREPGSGEWQFNSPAIIDPPSGATNKGWFGASMALDGSTLAIGAPAENIDGDPGTPDADDPRGKIFLYSRSGLSTWDFVTELQQETAGIDSDLGTALDYHNGLLIGGDPYWNIDDGAPSLGVGRSYWFLYQPGALSCDGDSISDACEIAAGGLADCDFDAVPDECLGNARIAVWTAEFKGVFSDPDAWCADLPSPDHNVIFLHESPDGLANEVVPIHDHTIRGLESRRGWHTLLGDLGTITVRAPGTQFGGFPLRIGTLPEYARLDLEGAALVVGDDLQPGSGKLAAVAGSSGEMHVSGADALLDISVDLIVADQGPAMLSIEDGAVVRCSQLTVGSLLLEDAEGSVFLPNPSDVLVPAPALFSDVQTTVKRGSITASSRATLSFGGSGLIINRDGAVYTDAPIIGNVTNVGTLRALTSPAEVFVSGSYNQVQGSGTLTQIGRLVLDLTDGSQHDVLHASGPATFDGALVISAEPGFDAPLDEQFEIIMADASFTGRFSVASFPGLPGYKFLRLQYAPGTGRISLIVDTLNSNQDSDFGDSQGYSVEQSVQDAALGLCTDDGVESYLDLVAVARAETLGDPGTLYVFENTGVPGVNGEVFTTIIGIDLPGDPIAVDTGDFDHDGFDDVVVLYSDGAFSVVHQINFTADPVTWDQDDFASAVPNPSDIVAADLDLGLGVDVTIVGADASGDGMIVSRLNAGGNGANWIGLGSARTAPSTGPGSLSFAEIGDLDNDEDLDLVAFRQGEAEAQRLLNQRGGVGGAWNGFGAAEPVDLGVLVVASDIGDLDNDKRVDIVAVGARADEGSFAVMLNSGNAVFEAPAVFPIGGRAGRMVLGKLDADDDLDAAVIVDDPSLGPVIRVLRNDFDGSQLAFTTSQDQSSELTPLLLLAGDLDQSGNDDLVVINDTATTGGLPPPRGVLDDVTYIPLIVESPPECRADLNGDGRLDFFDVQSFLAAFTSGDLSADWNGNGVLDFFDLQAFLNAYSQGCP